MCLLCTASLSSCASDKQAPTDANFRLAIQQVLADRPSCLPLSFPAYLPIYPQVKSEAHQLETLVTAGLVNAPHPVPVEPTMFIGWTRSADPKARPGLEYDLTARGQKYQRTVTLLLLKPQTRLCYAESKVTAIVRYTQPTPFLGRTVSQVTYKYQLGDLAPWALDSAIINAFHLQPELDERNQSKTGEQVLYLASDGWRGE